jgi:hypothetical protein
MPHAVMDVFCSSGGEFPIRFFSAKFPIFSKAFRRNSGQLAADFNKRVAGANRNPFTPVFFFSRDWLLVVGAVAEFNRRK